MSPKGSLPLRLGLLVAGIVLPLTFLAAALVYYNYETSRQTAYGRVLQIARGLATNIDGEFRSTIASLQVLALSEALERDDLVAFRKQAEHFVELHFPQSNVVVSDASGQQLLNTAVAPGTALPRYVRMDALRRVFASGEPQISGMVFGPVLRRNIVVVDVPVWRDGKVTYDLGASLPLSTFGNIVARQRPEPDWTIAVFDANGTVLARSRDPEQYIGKPASPSLRGPLTSQFEGALDTVTFDGIVVLTGFSRAPMSGWSAAVGIPKGTLTSSALAFGRRPRGLRNTLPGLRNARRTAAGNPACTHPGGSRASRQRAEPSRQELLRHPARAYREHSAVIRLAA